MLAGRKPDVGREAGPGEPDEVADLGSRPKCRSDLDAAQAHQRVDDRGVFAGLRLLAQPGQMCLGPLAALVVSAPVAQ